MSARIKRQLSKASGSAEGGGGAPSAAARKKRRIDNSGSDDEERSVWTPKHLGDLRAYNRSASEAPAELFRKDLISAMKLADNEPLTSDDYWGIGDPWKQEWERGVQVPVNPDSLPEPAVTTTVQRPRPEREGNFRLTKDKFIRVNHDDFFSNEQHILSNLPTKAEKMCRYDMDDLDDKWLVAYNGERARMGAAPVPPLIFEMIMEHLEETCWENIHKMLKTEESLSIEFDEDVICDVCRSPDSEEGNEMVFCDSCNICVHQACYGITAIPSGSWLCRTCSLGIKPDCVLCPNKGGAMKSTKSGQKWAHVACALWIPEVSIGSVERMEPITKIPNIPQSRWALVCVLCRERRGACIQCSVKTCKTAYHVTCAFKHGLEMKAIIEDESADDGVKLRSYCEKHSVASKKVGCEAESDAEEGAPKKKKDWTSEQKNQARAAKLRQIESEFYKHVDVLETSNFLDIDFETTETIFNYWKLKRRAGFNKPLLTPRSEEIDLLSHQQEHDIERMKMFVQLRQYLERVRNLCYMVSRRERLSRSFLKTREQTFSKQASILASSSMNLTQQEVDAVMQANHGPSVYDQLYSHPSAPSHTQKHFEKIIACIAGTLTEKVKPKKEPEKKDVNGLIRTSKDKTDNPYKKMYVNGAEQRRSRSSSLYSTSDSDSSLASTKWSLPTKGNTRYSVYTSSEEETNKENHSVKQEPPSSKSKLPFLDSSDKEKPKLEPISRPARGRVGRRRGTGRASAIKSRSFRDRMAHGSSEEDVKKFDNLITEKTVKTETNASSSKTVRERPSVDTSEDEAEPVSKPKPQPSKRRNKRKVTPSKLDSSVSSEDEPVVTVATAKEKKPSRRGKWSKNILSSQTTSVSSPVSEIPKLELSDDDELGPPTYKLSSDEDNNSEKSNEPAVMSSDIFGVSDRTDTSSDNGRDTALSKGPKKHDKKNESRISDSDVNSDDENKESTTDSQNHATLKTKAAKKEFTPKIEAKAERMNKKKTDKVGRTVRKTASAERCKSETRQSEEVEVEHGVIKSEVEATPGHMFVPQRKAAKKASELITSQNTTSTSANATAGMAGPATADVADVKKSVGKPVKEIKEDPDEPEIIEEKKVLEEKRITPTKGRKSKSTKEKNEKVSEEKSESSDVPKKNLFEPPEILPYVPMRQAAKKAAENLKGGNSKAGAAASSGTEESELPAAAPVVSPTKNKRISRMEGKSGPRSKSKSPRAAKPVSSATVSDSGSESDSDLKFSKSIFSDSDEESVIKKDKAAKDKTDPLTEVYKEAKTNKQFFRGDIYIRPYQSSSDENEEGRPATPGRKSLLSHTSKSTGDEFQDLSKNQLFRGPSSISGDLHLTSDSDEREDENQEPAAGTLRKAPDKKLKTSEGRPEHGFQPPITERSESGMSNETEDHRSKSPTRRETGLESRLRQSGSQCRPRTPPGDVSVQDFRSNSHAPSRGRRRGREREPVSLSQDIGTSHKLHTRREVQPEETLKSIKKTPERSSQEKSGSSKGSTAEKEETLKEKEVVQRDRKEFLREKKDPVVEKKEVLQGKESLQQKAKNDSLRERAVGGKEKQFVLPGDKEVKAAEKDLLPEITNLQGESNEIIIEKEVHKEKKESQREKLLSPIEKVVSPREKGLLQRKKVLSPREKVLSPREKVLSPREKVLSPREKVLSPREKVLSPKEKEGMAPEKVISPREKKDVLRGRDTSRERGESPKERREPIRDSDSLEEKYDKEKEPPKDKIETAEETMPVPFSKPDLLNEIAEPSREALDIFGQREKASEKVEPVLEKDRQQKQTEQPVREEDSRVAAEPPGDEREKDAIPKPAENVKRAEQQQKSGVFGFVGVDLEVERLEDIVETSDTEPEPKKVRIGDSDEDSINVVGEKRVEQPKDSGYKSAITTPEPVDRVHAVCNDMVNVNSVVNNFMSDESRLETVDVTSKTPVVLPTPVEGRQVLNKFVSPTRRKNLEDVIGEMKRQAEAQPEVQPEAQAEPTKPVPPPERQNEVTASSPPHSQANSFSVPPVPESSVASPQASSAEALPPKSSSSPGANFREQWRGQWEKSPPQAEHKVDPGTGPHLPPHLPMLGLELGLPSSMSMLDLQRAMYSADAQHPLFSAFDFLNARTMFTSQFRQMVEAGIHPPTFNTTLIPAYLQQHSANELAALSQQQYPPPARENQIPDKTSMCSQEMSRLSAHDDRPPTPELPTTDAKAGSRQATSSSKTTKPLSSPGSVMTAPPLSSPLAQSNKVVPGLVSPTTSRGQHTREEQPSPVLPNNKIAQPQPSPSSIYNKNESVPVSTASQPQATTVAPTDISSTSHSVLSSSVSRTASQPQVSPQSSKSSQAPVLSQQSSKPSQAPVVSQQSSKSSQVPVVSPQSTKPSQAPVTATTTSTESSVTITKVSRPLVSPARNSVVSSKMSIVPPASNSVVSVAKTITTTTTTTTTTSLTSASVSKSPLLSVTSPTTVPSQKESPLQIAVEVPDSKIETITVDDSVLHQKEEPAPKRVPIYMQEAKSQKAPEKKSPRSQASSPRWVNKESTKAREKKSSKVNRAAYNKGRGRSTGKGKGRGQSPRFNSISVPKELVGTVYDFDFDNEFDDGPANNTLDDLRKSREKRQSVDTTPQQSLTPTYTIEHKEQTKKSSKKSKSSQKEKGVTKSADDGDKVAKILEDYRNTQNSQLRRSTHSPSPPRGDDMLEGPSKSPDKIQDIPQFTSEFTSSIPETKLTISNLSDVRDSNPTSELSVLPKNTGDDSRVSLTVPTAQIGIDERTNQLKLKIKGPYANSYSATNTSAAPQEAVGAPTPTSTTSTLRRMRKKELIRQYCYQDQIPNEPAESGPINSTPNPPPQLRTGITIPKAVASMPSIPTREDYKMYTQDETPTGGGGGGRRKRPPRELRHLDWSVMEDSGKRNSETTEGGDVIRKRPRAAKEAAKNLDEKDVSSAKPPPKLRISLGKKGSEVTTVTADSKDFGGKQRPPKKRIAEENAMVKIKNDNMKFREQIMADFDKGEKKSGVKGTDREKKAKKRKILLGESSADGKDGSCDDQHDVKVFTGDSTNAPKLVIRFSKAKSESSSGNKNIKSEANNAGGHKEERSDSDSVMNPSLKIRLSVPKLDSESTKEESCIPKIPLKIKFSRVSDGYVASNTPRKLEADEQDQGPGPPAPKPPDLPPEPLHEKLIPETSQPSPPSSLPPPPTQQQPLPQQEQQQQYVQQQPQQPVQHAISEVTECPPHLESRIPQAGNIPLSLGPYDPGWPPSYSAAEQLGLPKMDYGLGSLNAPSRSECPEEMFQRLEAQIAATGGTVPEGGGPASSLGPRQTSGPPLPDVPSLRHTLYPYKEGSDCR
ncbi:PHD finger protein rhinoceros-like [Penaeus monodon]|uniref:PHD finger protein rhinoceros-like n=1 Tax=Penaeus monodon TaxID=6687 RepID=UPI0018A74AD1|nr:PHD finger protein rhinoceros-like [Penaeus monodon]